MIGSICGGSWNNNDNGILNLIGLADYLMSFLQPMIASGIGNFFPDVYGDGIFAVSATVFGRYCALLSDWEEIVNICMASLRICVEHLFSIYFNASVVISQHANKREEAPFEVEQSHQDV
jgi:hypothetical protein